MISIQTEDFNVGEEYIKLQRQSSSAGAIVTFTGLVRDLDKNLPEKARSEKDYSEKERIIKALELEHYPGMTEKTLFDITEQARARWPLDQIRIIHRVGIIQASEQIVFVGVSSSHRDAAFNACCFMMDFLKNDAPFWKKEIYPDGQNWVEKKLSDETAANKWKS